jgi:hypothetical protein
LSGGALRRHSIIGEQTKKNFEMLALPAFQNFSWFGLSSR